MHVFGRAFRRAYSFSIISPDLLSSSRFLFLGGKKQFHTEALKELLDDDDRFGFIVMDGNGCLYGTLQGSTREVSFSRY